MGARASGQARRTTKESITKVAQSQYISRKIEHLQRAVLKFKSLFSEITEFAGGPGYIIPDDFYHIRSVDQPDAIDYFHKVSKDANLWLKIGTLKHRTRYYTPGDPPRGIKASEDADDIDLDVTLERYETTKKFLEKILSQFVGEAEATVDEVLTDGAVDRLVLASGGVARDFLTIFRRSIAFARERTARGGTKGGEKIIAEDINAAAGAHDSSKREDFSLDTRSDEQIPLLDLFGRISRFCLDDAKANCFLLEKDFSEATRFLSGRFTQRVNYRDGRDGPIFRGRFTSVAVKSDAHLVRASRYIHRNPVEAGLVTEPWDWSWSSARGYVGLVRPPAWLHTNAMLEMFGPSRARENYRDFLKTEVDEATRAVYANWKG